MSERDRQRLLRAAARREDVRRQANYLLGRAAASLGSSFLVKPRGDRVTQLLVLLTIVSFLKQANIAFTLDYHPDSSKLIINNVRRLRRVLEEGEAEKLMTRAVERALTHYVNLVRDPFIVAACEITLEEGEEDG